MQYYERWFLKKKVGLNPISLEEAKSRHERNKGYCVLIENTAIVDIAGDWVSVNFIDEFLRPYLNYDFKKIYEDQLFLKGAIYREYEGNTDEIVASVVFNFKENGSYIAEKDGAECKSIEGNAPITDLLDSYPKFGVYDHLLQIERGVPDLA